MSTLQATDSSTKATDKHVQENLAFGSRISVGGRVRSVVRGRGCAVRCGRALVGACSALLGMGRGEITCARKLSPNVIAYVCTRVDRSGRRNSGRYGTRATRPPVRGVVPRAGVRRTRADTPGARLRAASRARG